MDDADRHGRGRTGHRRDPRHRRTPGIPRYWHARGYGLFAANPLGEKVLTEGKKELNLTLEPGKSTTFQFRVVILDGTAKPADIEKAYQAFAAQKSTAVR